MALSKPYIIDEVSKMDEHAELINGELVIRDSTSIEHNRITVKMARIIGNYIDSKNGNCEVFQENAALFCNELNSEFDNDFYLPDIKIGIECQGTQHFQPVERFGGVEGLKTTQERDALKKELCESNSVKIIYYANYKFDFPCDVIQSGEQLIETIKKELTNGKKNDK